MNLFDTIRNTIVPIHKEGYVFVAAFFVASLVLGWISEPLFWVGLVLTAWCAYFFRDPERVTPQDDDLIISPADGKVSAIQTVVPPLELELGKEPMVRISVFMNVFNCHVNRAPVRGRIVNVAYRPGLFLNAEVDKPPKTMSATASSSRQRMARLAWCRLPAWSPAVSSAGSSRMNQLMPASVSVLFVSVRASISSFPKVFSRAFRWARRQLPAKRFWPSSAPPRVRSLAVAADENRKGMRHGNADLGAATERKT